jgi:hypothetical protein
VVFACLLAFLLAIQVYAAHAAVVKRNALLLSYNIQTAVTACTFKPF